jgi:hypothetical protein
VLWNFSCSFEDAVAEIRTWRFLVPFQALSTRVQKAQLIYLSHSIYRFLERTSCGL